LSAQNKGALLSMEALLSLLAAASLMLLLPLASSQQPSAGSRIYQYQVLQDLLEVMDREGGLSEAADDWLYAGDGTHLESQLDPIVAGLGFCLRLEAGETSPAVNSPAECADSAPRDPVSTFRAIRLRHVNATLWKR